MAYALPIYLLGHFSFLFTGGSVFRSNCSDACLDNFFAFEKKRAMKRNDGASVFVSERVAIRLLIVDTVNFRRITELMVRIIG